HRRGVQREGPLHADTEGRLADREGLADATAGAGEDDTLEDLDTGPVPLDHLHVHLDRVTGAEIGDVVAQRCGVDAVQDVHRYTFPRLPQVTRACPGGANRLRVDAHAWAVGPAPLWQRR